MAPAEKVLESFPSLTAVDLIPLLQALQSAYGYLPAEVLLEVAERTGIPASRMYGVVTFYEQFHVAPRGRHTIRCCRGTACHVNDGPGVIEAIRQALGIDEGGTTSDFRFTFETVACIGTCFLAPAMMVNNDYYGHLTPKRIKGILAEYK